MPTYTRGKPSNMMTQSLGISALPFRSVSSVHRGPELTRVKVIH
jgi:hypothetical protein